MQWLAYIPPAVGPTDVSGSSWLWFTAIAAGVVAVLVIVVVAVGVADMRRGNRDSGA